MNKRGVLILVILIILIFSLVLPLASAGIIEGKIVDANNNPVTLEFDETTSSYADGTNTNPNIYFYLNSNTPLNDLKGKYIILAYQVGDIALATTVSLKQITSENNVAKLDLDLSTGKAYYPGILSVVLSNSTGFIPDRTVYYPLSTSTGLLNGNYGLTVSESDSDVTVRIDNVTDSNGNLIETVKSYVIIGVRGIDSTIIHDNALTQPGGQVTLSHPGSDFEFVVNGLVISDYNVGELTAVETAMNRVSGIQNECGDDQDNDGDGLIDYPYDPGCVSTFDNNEIDEPTKVLGEAGMEVWYEGTFGDSDEIVELEHRERCLVCEWPEEPTLQEPLTFWEMVIENYVYIILAVLTLVLLTLLGKLMHKTLEAIKIENNLKELDSFVKSQRAEGVSDRKIKRDLVNAGRTEGVVEEFMNNNK